MASLYRFAESTMQETLEAASQTAKQYEQALFNLLECLDLTTEEGADRAHGLLQHIAIIQSMQATLEQPAPDYAALRGQAFTQMLAHLQKEPF